MIRSESEYRNAVERLREEESRMTDREQELAELDLSREEIKRAMDPLRSFHDQLQEEVASYENLKRGKFEELRNFEGLGRMLVALRIARGLSQRELAERLGVHESQISRDERNEYHGITVQRAGKILDALGASTRTQVVSLDSDLTTATATEAKS